MNIQEELLKTIEIIAQNAVSKVASDIPSTIIRQVSEENNSRYIVLIDGGERIARNGLGVPLKVGTPVWLHNPHPDKNLNDIYISAIRNGATSYTSSGGGSYDNIFIGTMAQYNLALAQGKIKVGMLVIISDD